MSTNNSLNMENVETDNKGETQAAVAPPLDPGMDLWMDLGMKHPLQNSWTFWYFENDKTQPWEKSQHDFASVETIEDFWSLYEYLKPASELKQGTDYSLFKTGIRPMWEDDQNKNGGRWLFNLDKKQRATDLDRCWLDIILCLIGETFENSDEICGVVVNVRYKGDKIGVWTQNANKRAAVMEIGRKLKERLNIPPRKIIGYEVHKNSMNKSGSGSKYSYTI